MFDKRILCAGLAFMMMLPITGCSADTARPSAADDGDPEDEEGKEPTIVIDEKTKEEFTGETPVDNEYVTLTVSSITEDLGADRYVWNAELTNKSGQVLYTSIPSVSVNDFVLSSLQFDGAVNPGETKPVEITFNGSDLIKNDIDEVAKASFDFYVSDESGNTLKTDSAVIYPFGETYYERGSRVKYSDELTVFDNEFGTLIVTGFDSYQYKYEVEIYFENKSGRALILDVTDESGYTKSFIDSYESPETNVAVSYIPAEQRTNTEIQMAIEQEYTEASTVSFVISLRAPEDNSILFQQSVTVNPW